MSSNNNKRFSPNTKTMGIPDHVEMKEVRSSKMSHVGYDQTTNTLYVRFKRGSEYAYPNFSVTKHNEMMNQTSLGSWFYQEVEKKPVTHPARKIR